MTNPNQTKKVVLTPEEARKIINNALNLSPDWIDGFRIKSAKDIEDSEGNLCLGTIGGVEFYRQEKDL